MKRNDTVVMLVRHFNRNPFAVTTAFAEENSAVASTAEKLFDRVAVVLYIRRTVFGKERELP